MHTKKPKRGPDWPWKIEEGSAPVWLDSIEMDRTLHVRSRIQPDTAKKYADEKQAGMLFPPVSLGKVGSKLYLLDGWHRIDAAALRNGADTVEARVTPMTISEAVWAACAANLTHGQGYSTKEKRNVLRAFIRARKHMRGGEVALSYRDISGTLGIKLPTLYRWMEQDHPTTFRAMQKEAQLDTSAEPPAMDRDPEYLRRAQQGIREALACSDALRCPELRQEVIEEAANALERMKQKEHHEKEW